MQAFIVTETIERTEMIIIINTKNSVNDTKIVFNLLNKSQKEINLKKELFVGLKKKLLINFNCNNTKKKKKSTK